MANDRVEVLLLGPVEAVLNGVAVRLTRLEWQLLAVLAVSTGRVVPVGGIVDALWPEAPPRSSRNRVQALVSGLRRALGPVVETTGPGYRLNGCELDTVAFDRTISVARTLVAERRPVDAVRAYRDAAALWRGDPFGGMPGLVTESARLSEACLAVLDERIGVELTLGGHADLVGELSGLVAQHPTRERFVAHLMLALYRSGRQADALECCHLARRRFRDELGLDPGPELMGLYERILARDPSLALAEPAMTRPMAAIDGGTGTNAEEPVPRQLPAPPRWFTGRGTELARLDEVLTAEQDVDPRPSGSGSGTRAAATVVISAIGGAGGIGKTWLALAWGHRHLDRFADGQLFADLRGFTPTERPVTPDAALFGFLTALGVAPDRVPADLDGKAALYRSMVAGRRILVVLDNAASSDQVIPLLPGTPTCTVLVTGRVRLASLLDRHGARHQQLDVLAHAEARALLAARLGTGGVAAEPGAVDELVELCGGYPLALSIAARHAAARPGTRLAEVAAELRVLGLEMLDHDTDPAASLPAVLSWSLRRLTDEQRTVFGLLGIAPGADTTLPAVAALTGLPLARARKALLALGEASLLERRPDSRYAMHDLVRAYAVTTSHDLPADVRESALIRVTDYHLHTAHAADRLLDPHRPLLQPGPRAPGVHPHSLPDAATATAWLQAERATLLATQRAAAAFGRHHVVWHLAWALDTFHYRRGHRHDALTMWQAAVDAADHLPDPALRCCAHRNLGRICARLGLHEGATGHLDRALNLAVRHHDRAEQAHTHHVLAHVWGRRGDGPRALEHARHALHLFRAVDQPLGEAHALNTVGWFAARLGDLDTARDHCRAALTLHRHHHHFGGQAAALDSLGLIAHRTGDHRQAVGHFHQALSLFRTVGNTYQVAATLDRVGQTHAVRGHHQHAREVWREALELYREQGRDDDAERVQRQLDDLAPAPESIMPSDAGETTEKG